MLKFSWQIVYWGKYGKSRMSVSAENRKAAIRISGIPVARVIRVRCHWLNLYYIRLRLMRPDEKTQLNILLNMQAHCLTGNFDKAAAVLHSNSTMNIFASLYSTAMREDLEISRQLRMLQFDPEICAAIENGEQAGNLSLGVEEAIQYLKRMMKLRTETSRQFILGLIMLIASVGIFFFVLPLMSESFKPLLEIESIGFSSTIATVLLLAISDFIAANRIGILLVIFFICCAVFFYYPKIKHLPPFSMFDKLGKNRRSIKFLAAWTLYRVSGMVMETDHRSLCRILGDKVGNTVYRALEHGQSLSDVITTRYFSPTLVGAMPALCCFQVSELKNISVLLLENLIEEQNQQSKVIAGVFYALAVAISLTLVFMLAYGLIFPMFSMVAGFRL